MIVTTVLPITVVSNLSMQSIQYITFEHLTWNKSLMLNKKAGYRKKYLLSAIILKNLVSCLSDTGHFMIKIWGISGHLLDFYKMWCVSSTHCTLHPYQFWPSFWFMTTISLVQKSWVTNER